MATGSSRAAKLRLLSFAALVLMACFALASKVGAQGAPLRPGGGGGGGGGAPLRPPAAEAPKATRPEPAPDKTDPAEAREKRPAEGGDDEETADQLKTAVAGPEGGVPVHAEGPNKSPFAAPKRQLATAKVGFLLETIDEYDIKKGAFTAHFFVSLTSDKPMPKVDLKATNGKLDESELLADLPTFKMWKMVGAFSSKPDLHAYPFDTQELDIELEDDSNGLDQLRLRTDQSHTYLDTDFGVPGWDTVFLRARILNHYYPDRFEHDDLYYSKYKFTLGIKRFALSAMFTVFVPALVIVLISLSGLWFPREELEVRSNATTPMLAAAVLFHFALMQELPATAYLSRADKLMMGVYLCLFLHMLSSWIWFVVGEEHTDRLFRLTKWIGAPVTFAVMASAIFL